MKPLETTRQTVTDLVKDFLVTNFPSLSVDYPHKTSVDVEAVSEFVKFELLLTPKPLTLPGNSAYEISGEVFLTHYRRENGGSSAFTSFTDEFFNSFSMQTKNGITFYTVKPYEQSGLPGFDGVTNVVAFSIDKFS